MCSDILQCATPLTPNPLGHTYLYSLHHETRSLSLDLINRNHLPIKTSWWDGLPWGVSLPLRQLKAPLLRSWLYCYFRYITMHNSITTNLCKYLFSMSGNKMVPVHVKRHVEVIVITKMRAFKHEPLVSLGGWGGGGDL